MIRNSPKQKISYLPSLRDAKTITAFVVSAVFFYSNVMTACAAESAFWGQRREAASRMKKSAEVTESVSNLGLAAEQSRGLSEEQNQLLAQLPKATNFDFGMPESVTNGLPSNKITRESLKAAQGKNTPAWISSLILPYGAIRDVYLSKSPNAPIIVHIQDAHGIEDAQKNMASMIEGLREERGITLVGMEGAQGEFALGPYRAFPDPAVTKGIAEYFMKDGTIGGPEYVGLTSPQPPLLWGVEDLSKYESNIQAFKDSVKYKPAMSAYLGELKEALMRLKAKSFSQNLRAFDQHYSAYKNRQENLGAYVRYLMDTQQGNDLKFPNLKILLDALEWEESLDFKKVEAERLLLVETMAKKLSEEQLSYLVQQSLLYRLGRMGYGDYHRFLRKLCRENKIDLELYPQLNSYITYVLLAEQINRNELLVELSSAEQSAQDALAVTPEQKKLVAINRNLILLDKMTQHSMTMPDWLYFDQNKNEILKTAERMKEVAAQLNVTLALSPDQAVPLASAAADQDWLKSDWSSEPETKTMPFAAMLQPYEDFCRYAMGRNNSLVENLLDKIHKEKLSSAILVAGGFHTEGLTQLLRQKDISYVVVTPKINEVPKEDHYLDVFAHDPLPIEKMFSGEQIYLVAPRLTAGSTNPAELQSRRFNGLYAAFQAAMNAVGENPELDETERHDVINKVLRAATDIAGIQSLSMGSVRSRAGFYFRVPFVLKQLGRRFEFDIQSTPIENAEAGAALADKDISSMDRGAQAEAGQITIADKTFRVGVYSTNRLTGWAWGKLHSKMVSLDEGITVLKRARNKLASIKDMTVAFRSAFDDRRIRRAVAVLPSLMNVGAMLYFFHFGIHDLPATLMTAAAVIFSSGHNEPVDRTPARQKPPAPSNPYPIFSSKRLEYALSIPELVNPNNEPRTVLYGAAGFDLSVLLSTNGDNFIFAGDSYPESENAVASIRRLLTSSAGKEQLFHAGASGLPAALNAPLGLQQYLDDKSQFGYGTRRAFSATGREWFWILAAELAALGINFSEVTVEQGADKGSFKLSFDWRHPRDTVARKRSIIFYQVDDFTIPEDYPASLTQLLDKGIDIYYQRAAATMADKYEEPNSYIQRIYKAVRPGGYFITDDRAMHRSGEVHDYGSDFPLKEPFIKNIPIESDLTAEFLRDENTSGYGNLLTIRQVEAKPVPAAPPATDDDKTENEIERYIAVQKVQYDRKLPTIFIPASFGFYFLNKRPQEKIFLGPQGETSNIYAILKQRLPGYNIIVIGEQPLSDYPDRTKANIRGLYPDGINFLPVHDLTRADLNMDFDNVTVVLHEDDTLFWQRDILQAANIRATNLRDRPVITVPHYADPQRIAALGGWRTKEMPLGVSSGDKWLIPVAIDEAVGKMVRGEVAAQDAIDDALRFGLSGYKEDPDLLNGYMQDFKGKTFSISYPGDLNVFLTYMFLLANLIQRKQAYPNGIVMELVLKRGKLTTDGKIDDSTIRRNVALINQRLADLYPDKNPPRLIFPALGGQPGYITYDESGDVVNIPDTDQAEGNVPRRKETDIIIVPTLALPQSAFNNAMAASARQTVEPGSWWIPSLMSGINSYISAAIVHLLFHLPALHDGRIEHLGMDFSQNKPAHLSQIQQFILDNRYVDNPVAELERLLFELTNSLFSRSSDNRKLETTLANFFIRQDSIFKASPQTNVDKYQQFKDEMDGSTALVDLILSASGGTQATLPGTENAVRRFEAYMRTTKLPAIVRSAIIAVLEEPAVFYSGKGKINSFFMGRAPAALVGLIATSVLSILHQNPAVALVLTVPLAVIMAFWLRGQYQFVAGHDNRTIFETFKRTAATVLFNAVTLAPALLQNVFGPLTIFTAIQGILLSIAVHTAWNLATNDFRIAGREQRVPLESANNLTRPEDLLAMVESFIGDDLQLQEKVVTEVIERIIAQTGERSSEIMADFIRLITLAMERPPREDDEANPFLDSSFLVDTLAALVRVKMWDDQLPSGDYLHKIIDIVSRRTDLSSTAIAAALQEIANDPLNQPVRYDPQKPTIIVPTLFGLTAKESFRNLYLGPVGETSNLRDILQRRLPGYNVIVVSNSLLRDLPDETKSNISQLYYGGINYMTVDQLAALRPTIAGIVIHEEDVIDWEKIELPAAWKSAPYFKIPFYPFLSRVGEQGRPTSGIGISVEPDGKWLIPVAIEDSIRNILDSPDSEAKAREAIATALNLAVSRLPHVEGQQKLDVEELLGRTFSISYPRDMNVFLSYMVLLASLIVEKQAYANGIVIELVLRPDQLSALRRVSERDFFNSDEFLRSIVRTTSILNQFYGQDCRLLFPNQTINQGYFTFVRGKMVPVPLTEVQKSDIVIMPTGYLPQNVFNDAMVASARQPHPWWVPSLESGINSYISAALVQIIANLPGLHDGTIVHLGLDFSRPRIPEKEPGHVEINRFVLDQRWVARPVAGMEEVLDRLSSAMFGRMTNALTLRRIIFSFLNDQIDLFQANRQIRRAEYQAFLDQRNAAPALARLIDPNYVENETAWPGSESLGGLIGGLKAREMESPILKRLFNDQLEFIYDIFLGPLQENFGSLGLGVISGAVLMLFLSHFGIAVNPAHIIFPLAWIWFFGLHFTRGTSWNNRGIAFGLMTLNMVISFLHFSSTWVVALTLGSHIVVNAFFYYVRYREFTRAKEEIRHAAAVEAQTQKININKIMRTIYHHIIFAENTENGLNALPQRIFSYFLPNAANGVNIGRAAEELIKAVESNNPQYHLFRPVTEDTRVLTFRISRTDEGFVVKDLNDHIGSDNADILLIEWARPHLQAMLDGMGFSDLKITRLYSTANTFSFVLTGTHPEAKELNRKIAAGMADLQQAFSSELRKMLTDEKFSKLPASLRSLQLSLNYGMSEIGRGNLFNMDIQAYQASFLPDTENAPGHVYDRGRIVDKVKRFFKARDDLNAYNEALFVRSTLDPESHDLVLNPTVATAIRTGKSFSELAADKTKTYAAAVALFDNPAFRTDALKTPEDAFNKAREYNRIANEIQDGGIKRFDTFGKNSAGAKSDFEIPKNDAKEIGQLIEKLRFLSEPPLFRAFSLMFNIKNSRRHILSEDDIKKIERYAQMDARMGEFVVNTPLFHLRAARMENPTYVACDLVGLWTMNMDDYERAMKKINDFMDQGKWSEVEKINQTAADDVTLRLRNLVLAIRRYFPETEFKIVFKMQGDEVNFAFERKNPITDIRQAELDTARRLTAIQNEIKVGDYIDQTVGRETIEARLKNIQAGKEKRGPLALPNGVRFAVLTNTEVGYLRRHTQEATASKLSRVLDLVNYMAHAEAMELNDYEPIAILKALEKQGIVGYPLMTIAADAPKNLFVPGPADLHDANISKRAAIQSHGLFYRFIDGSPSGVNPDEPRDKERMSLFAGSEFYEKYLAPLWESPLLGIISAFTPAVVLAANISWAMQFFGVGTNTPAGLLVAGLALAVSLATWGTFWSVTVFRWAHQFSGKAPGRGPPRAHWISVSMAAATGTILFGLSAAGLLILSPLSFLLLLASAYTIAHTAIHLYHNITNPSEKRMALTNPANLEVVDSAGNIITRLSKKPDTPQDLLKLSSKGIVTIRGLRLNSSGQLSLGREDGKPWAKFGAHKGGLVEADIEQGMVVRVRLLDDAGQLLPKGEIKFVRIYRGSTLLFAFYDKLRLERLNEFDGVTFKDLRLSSRGRLRLGREQPWGAFDDHKEGAVEVDVEQGKVVTVRLLDEAGQMLPNGERKFMRIYRGPILVDTYYGGLSPTRMKELDGVTVRGLRLNSIGQLTLGREDQQQWATFGDHRNGPVEADVGQGKVVTVRLLDKAGQMFPDGEKKLSRIYRGNILIDTFNEKLNQKRLKELDGVTIKDFRLDGDGGLYFAFRHWARFGAENAGAPVEVKIENGKVVEVTILDERGQQKGMLHKFNRVYSLDGQLVETFFGFLSPQRLRLLKGDAIIKDMVLTNDGSVSVGSNPIKVAHDYGYGKADVYVRNGNVYRALLKSDRKGNPIVYARTGDNYGLILRRLFLAEEDFVKNLAKGLAQAGFSAAYSQRIPEVLVRMKGKSIELLMKEGLLTQVEFEAIRDLELQKIDMAVLAGKLQSLIDDYNRQIKNVDFDRSRQLFIVTLLTTHLLPWSYIERLQRSYRLGRDVSLVYRALKHPNVEAWVKREQEAAQARGRLNRDKHLQIDRGQRRTIANNFARSQLIIYRWVLEKLAKNAAQTVSLPYEKISSNGVITIELQNQTPPRIRRGRILTLGSNRDSRKFRVVDVNEDGRVLTLVEDDPTGVALPTRGTLLLTEDDASLARQQHVLTEAIRAVDAGTDSKGQRIIQQVLGLAAWPAHSNPLPSFTFYNSKIPFANGGDEAQETAVRLAINATPVLSIEGPPGTGKTTVITEIVRQYVRQGKKVLVLSQGHAAVDNMVLRLTNADADPDIPLLRVGSNPAYIDQEVRNRGLWLGTARTPKEEWDARQEDFQRKRRVVAAREGITQAGVVVAGTNMGVVMDGALARLQAGSLGGLVSSFDVIIMDEASRAIPAETLPALRLLREDGKDVKVIFVGDENQLPPFPLDDQERTVIKNAFDSELSRRPDQKAIWGVIESFDQSLFGRVLSQGIGDRVMLSTNYRSHPLISGLVSTLFYNGDINRRGWEDFKPETLSLRVIDLADDPDTYYEQKDPQNNSFYNMESARRVVALVQRYHDKGEISLADMTILTPYNAQATRLRHMLRQAFRGMAEADLPKVMTIDSYQGQENKVVILDFVRSNPEKQIGFVKDLRRLNVALSRAQDNLAIVWDSRTFTEEPGARDTPEDHAAREKFKLLKDYYENEVRTFFPETVDDQSALSSPGAFAGIFLLANRIFGTPIPSSSRQVWNAAMWLAILEGILTAGLPHFFGNNLVAAGFAWAAINAGMHFLGVFTWNQQTRSWDIIPIWKSRGPPSAPWKNYVMPFLTANAIASTSLMASLSLHYLGMSLLDIIFFAVLPHLGISLWAIASKVKATAPQTMSHASEDDESVGSQADDGLIETIKNVFRVAQQKGEIKRADFTTGMEYRLLDGWDGVHLYLITDASRGSRPGTFKYGDPARNGLMNWKDAVVPGDVHDEKCPFCRFVKNETHELVPLSNGRLWGVFANAYPFAPEELFHSMWLQYEQTPDGPVMVPRNHLLTGNDVEDLSEIVRRAPGMSMIVNGRFAGHSVDHFHAQSFFRAPNPAADHWTGDSADKRLAEQGRSPLEIAFAKQRRQNRSRGLVGQINGEPIYRVENWATGSVLVFNNTPGGARAAGRLIDEVHSSPTTVVGPDGVLQMASMVPEDLLVTDKFIYVMLTVPRERVFGARNMIGEIVSTPDEIEIMRSKNSAGHPDGEVNGMEQISSRLLSWEIIEPVVNGLPSFVPTTPSHGRQLHGFELAFLELVLDGLMGSFRHHLPTVQKLTPIGFVADQRAMFLKSFYPTEKDIEAEGEVQREDADLPFMHDPLTFRRSSTLRVLSFAISYLDDISDQIKGDFTRDQAREELRYALCHMFLYLGARDRGSPVSMAQSQARRMLFGIIHRADHSCSVAISALLMYAIGRSENVGAMLTEMLDSIEIAHRVGQINDARRAQLLSSLAEAIGYMRIAMMDAVTDEETTDLLRQAFPKEQSQAIGKYIRLVNELKSSRNVEMHANEWDMLLKMLGTHEDGVFPSYLAFMMTQMLTPIKLLSDAQQISVLGNLYAQFYRLTRSFAEAAQSSAAAEMDRAAVVLILAGLELHGPEYSWQKLSDAFDVVLALANKLSNDSDAFSLMNKELMAFLRVMADNFNPLVKPIRRSKGPQPQDIDRAHKQLLELLGIDQSLIDQLQPFRRGESLRTTDEIDHGTPLRASGGVSKTSRWGLMPWLMEIVLWVFPTLPREKYTVIVAPLIEPAVAFAVGALPGLLLFTMAPLFGFNPDLIQSMAVALWGAFFGLHFAKTSTSGRAPPQNIAIAGALSLLNIGFAFASAPLLALIAVGIIPHFVINFAGNKLRHETQRQPAEPSKISTNQWAAILKTVLSDEPARALNQLDGFVHQARSGSAGEVSAGERERRLELIRQLQETLRRAGVENADVAAAQMAAWAQGRDAKVSSHTIDMVFAMEAGDLNKSISQIKTMKEALRATISRNERRNAESPLTVIVRGDAGMSNKQIGNKIKSISGIEPREPLIIVRVGPGNISLKAVSTALQQNNRQLSTKPLVVGNQSDFEKDDRYIPEFIPYSIAAVMDKAIQLMQFIAEFA